MVFHTHSRNAKGCVPRINNTNLEKSLAISIPRINFELESKLKKNARTM